MLFAFAAAIFHNAAHCPKSKRVALTAIGSILLIATFGFPLRAANETVDFRPAAKAGSFRQSKVIVEVEGKLKLNADGKEVKHLPFKVQGELNYVERVLSQSKSWTDVRLLRTYQSAQARLRLHESDLATELRPDRRLIAIQSSAKEAIQFSPSGPLTREELDLVEAPASGLALEALLPSGTMKISGQWPLTDTVVARLLNLEAVSQQDVSCTLDSVKDNIAIISLSGKVAGAVGGVSSDIELKGKLNFDLAQRAVTWLTLAIKENRAIGHAQPGFDVLAKLRMVSAPTKPVDELGDKALASLTLQPDAAQTLIELNSDAGGFQLLHDRRWSVMLERGDLTILRLVDRGDLIAQCNITPLAPLAKDQQLSMEGFQNDVKRVLGKNFEEMIEATEDTGENSLRALRVVVAGTVGELPIQWTYYNLADDAGRRASLVFTLESSLLSRFAHIDRELIANFRFIEGKHPTVAEPAPTSQSERETAVEKDELRR
jgi:hypothetical protein